MKQTYMKGKVYSRINQRCIILKRREILTFDSGVCAWTATPFLRPCLGVSSSPKSISNHILIFYSIYGNITKSSVVIIINSLLYKLRNYKSNEYII